MEKYTIVSPVLLGGVYSGEIELNVTQAQRLLELGAIEGEIREEEKEPEDMTVVELRAYAKQKNIELDGATKKEDILMRVQTAPNE